MAGSVGNVSELLYRVRSDNCAVRTDNAPTAVDGVDDAAVRGLGREHRLAALQVAAAQLAKVTRVRNSETR